MYIHNIQTIILKAKRQKALRQTQMHVIRQNEEIVSRMWWLERLLVSQSTIHWTVVTIIRLENT